MITVVSATAYKVSQHALAIARTLAALPLPAKGLLISPSRPAELPAGVDWSELQRAWIPRGEWTKIEGPQPGEWNLAEYSRFLLQGLVDYIDTEFCIVCQSDGYGLHRDRWTDFFLRYDYCGAPWPSWMNIGRVGNGGFSLRSHRWLTHASNPRTSPPFDHPQVHWSDDCYSCTVFRPFYEQAGLKIAPLGVAARFSLEHAISEFPQRTAADCFGFHGSFHPSTKNLPL